MTRLWKCIAAALVISGLCFAAAEAKEFKGGGKAEKSGTAKVRMGWESGWKENFRATHTIGHKSPGFKKKPRGLGNKRKGHK
jgi:hypothetical protein